MLVLEGRRSTGEDCADTVRRTWDLEPQASLEWRGSLPPWMRGLAENHETDPRRHDVFEAHDDPERTARRWTAAAEM